MKELTISDIFKGNEDAYGTFIDSGERDHRGKAKGACRTLALKEGQKLSESKELWEAHLKGEQSIGVIPINKQNECYWGCIDIDSYKGFNHKELLTSIERAELPFIVFKSKSGGAHVYCFFKDPVKAKILRKRLTEASALLGFKGSEIFPKQKELPNGFFGNYVNTPYFNAENTDRYAMKLNKDEIEKLSLPQFYNYYQEKVVDGINQFVIKTDTIFPEGPPCNNCIALRGCSEGGRNNYLFNVGVMLKRMSQENNEDWLDKLRAVNNKYMKTPLSRKEVDNIYASIANHTEHTNNSVLDITLDEETNQSYHYLCKQEPLQSYCDRGTCVGRKFGVTRPMNIGDEEFQITQIHKVLDDPIFYFITFESGIVMKAEIKEMTDQKLWREKVFATLDAKPPRLAANDFDTFMNVSMREHLEVVQLPEGVSRSDRIKSAIESWLTGTGAGDDKESVLTGSSFHDVKKKKVWFRFQDLREALVATKDLRNTQTDTTMLLDFIKRGTRNEAGEKITNPGLGATDGRLNVNGKTIFCWYISDTAVDMTATDIEPKDIIKEDAF